MEIDRRDREGVIEIAVRGRLDAYWADHLGRALEEALRAGADELCIEMSGVSYMSSVGIRVLLRFHKQLEGLGRSFRVVAPSRAVESVLELAGLAALLGAPAAARGLGGQGAAHVRRDGMEIEIFELAPGARLAWRAVGEPERLTGGRFDAAQCGTVRAGESVLAVGLGALGSGFADCEGRFGEMLAVGGGAAYQPTDGTNAADYLLGTRAFVPEVQMLYGIVCDGRFARLLRFDAADQPRGVSADQPCGVSAVRKRVGIGALAAACLDLAEADAIGIAIVAESAGLMGASLRRSPAQQSGFDFDARRLGEWLSFTPERVHARGLALIAGVVARGEISALAPLLRPLGGGGSPAAHLHAAAFSYSPLRKGPIELGPTVAGLFERENLQAVLHLLNDDREIVGGGESELVRGACWVAPLAGGAGAR